MIRIPLTDNKSLQAWNAADELLINTINNTKTNNHSLLLFNDRFGYLSKQSKSEKIYAYIDSKSQKEAIETNTIKDNKSCAFILKNEDIPKVSAILIHIPKSLDVLQTYLALAYDALAPDGNIYLGFMTKHFTNRYLTLCGTYFTNVSQSKAVKKARVITLNGKTQDKPYIKEKTEIPLPDGTSHLVQYNGVFSNEHIDYATLFLIENLVVKEDEKTILDMGSGNGIISYHIDHNYRDKEIHLLEDSYIAHLSGKMNLTGNNIHHHWNFSLQIFKEKQFDLIITNPPFHFGHEIDLSISMNLIKSTKHQLRSKGRLIIVSNNHINYTNILNELFDNSRIIASNKKFNIWEATN